MTELANGRPAPNKQQQKMGKPAFLDTKNGWSNLAVLAAEEDSPEDLGVCGPTIVQQYALVVTFCASSFLSKDLPVLAKKTIARKFGAKASFEAWSTALYVKIREESEFEVKSGPNYEKTEIFKF